MTRVMCLSVLIVLMGCGAPSERDVGVDALQAPVGGRGLDADQAETTSAESDTPAEPDTLQDITDTLTPPNADIDEVEHPRIDAPEVEDSQGGGEDVDSNASPPPMEATDAADDTHALVDGVVEDTTGERGEQPQEDTTETVDSAMDSIAVEDVGGEPTEGDHGPNGDAVTAEDAATGSSEDAQDMSTADQEVCESALDQDCDGVPATADCDDLDPDLGDEATDQNCDGLLDDAQCAPYDATSWPTRVLFIGNSYTGYHGGLNTMYEAVAASHLCAGDAQVTTARHAPGGKKIHQHYAAATSPGSSLHTLLNDPDGWDIVVLQDQSQVPGFPAASSPDKVQNLEVIDDFALLVESIGARLVLFMTWGRRDRDSNNSWLYPDYPTMQAELASGYMAYAEAASDVTSQPVEIAPVGYGWQSVYESGANGQTSAPEAQARFNSLYAADGSHPSIRGTYLAAAVFFELLTQAPSHLSIWTPSGVDGDTQAWITKAASDAFML